VCAKHHITAHGVGREDPGRHPAPLPPRGSMHGLVENGPAVNAGLPFVLLHKPALCTCLAEHRHPWPTRVHEHTLITIIDLKFSQAGWTDSGAGIVTDFGLSAEWADHLISLVSVSIFGRAP